MADAIPNGAPLQNGAPGLRPKYKDDVPRYELYKTLPDGHTMAVTALAFSNAENGYLASASADTTAKIWDPLQGLLIKTLEGHTKGISDLSWDALGEKLCTASDDFTLKLWDAAKGECLRTLEGHTSYVFCCCFAPIGNALVSGSFDETVRVWDARTGHCLREIPAHSDPVTAVDYHRDGTLIVSTSYDGLCRIWNTDDGKCVKTIMDDTNPPLGYARFAPNGRYIMTCSLDSRIKLWDFDLLKLLKTYDGHVNEKHCVFSTFSVTDRKGRWLISGSEDHSVCIWHLNGRHLVQRIPGKESKEAEGDGHCDAVLAVACNPRRAMIASGALQKDCSIKLWVDRSDPTIPAQYFQ